MVLFFTPSSSIQRVVLIPPPTMKGSPQQEFDEVRWMSFDELLAKGHPEKLVLFEKLAFLTPPVMQAFLSSRNLAPDVVSSSSRSPASSTSTHAIHAHGERVGENALGAGESGGKATRKEMNPSIEESRGQKAASSFETERGLSHM